MELASSTLRTHAFDQALNQFVCSEITKQLASDPGERDIHDGGIEEDDPRAEEAYFAIEMKQALSAWCSAAGNDLDRQQAAVDVLRTVLGQAFKSCSLFRRDYVQRLETTTELWLHSEDVIKSVLVRMDGDFYRDHLDHLVRVLLVSLAIYAKFPEIQARVEWRFLALAAVYHDIAMPMQKFPAAMERLAHRLSRAFEQVQEAKWPLLDQSMVERGVAQVERILGRPTVDANRGELNRHNHAFHGAVELALALTDDGLTEVADAVPATQGSSEASHVRGVIRAVFFHDSRISATIDGDEDPYAAIVSVADEAQDWGRVHSSTEAPAVDDLEGFVGGSALEFVLKVRDESSAPAIDMFGAKLRSLGRLRWPAGWPPAIFQIGCQEVNWREDAGRVLLALADAMRKVAAHQDIEQLAKAFGEGSSLETQAQVLAEAAATLDGYDLMLFGPRSSAVEHSELVLARKEPKVIRLEVSAGNPVVVSVDGSPCEGPQSLSEKAWGASAQGFLSGLCRLVALRDTGTIGFAKSYGQRRLREQLPRLEPDLDESQIRLISVLAGIEPQRWYTLGP